MSTSPRFYNTLSHPENVTPSGKFLRWILAKISLVWPKHIKTDREETNGDIEKAGWNIETLTRFFFWSTAILCGLLQVLLLGGYSATLIYNYLTNTTLVCLNNVNSAAASTSVSTYCLNSELVTVNLLAISLYSVFMYATGFITIGLIAIITNAASKLPLSSIFGLGSTEKHMSSQPLPGFSKRFCLLLITFVLLMQFSLAVIYYSRPELDEPKEFDCNIGAASYTCYVNSMHQIHRWILTMNICSVISIFLTLLLSLEDKHYEWVKSLRRVGSKKQSKANTDNESVPSPEIAPLSSEESSSLSGEENDDLEQGNNETDRIIDVADRENEEKVESF